MKSLTMALTALMIGMAIPALAEDGDDRGRHEREGSRYHERDRDHDDRAGAAAARAGWLSEAEVTRKLAEGGLTATRIKAEHGRFEVYATDASGVRVKVYVNPTTGAIIRRDDRG
jgi:Peptidase propeptide and YPEB domain